jgi:guanylate kinase
MSMVGVILYGPPAAGKDTVTDALCGLERPYVRYEPLKAGRGRTSGYRMTTVDELERMEQAGELVWVGERYGARYAVDRAGLRDAFARGIAVVHAGRVSAVTAIRGAGGWWLTVELWCARDVAADRLRQRGTADLKERLAVWDSTERAPDADLMIDTGHASPLVAAALIDTALGAAGHLEHFVL